MTIRGSGAARCARAAAIAAMTAFCLSTTASGADLDAPGCFWGRPTDPDVVNVFYPDEGATYWAARPVFSGDGEIVLHGVFPHARYMSFNVYDQELAPVDSLADVEIAPDAGSTNPFLENGDRNASNRAYAVRLTAGPKPEAPEPNTIYMSLASVGSPAGTWLLYRVYVPDGSRDLTGDAGLPAAELRLGDGTVVDLTAGCNPADATNPIGGTAPVDVVRETFSDGSAPGAPLGYPAQDPVAWEKFFNLAHIQAVTYTDGTPAREAVDESLGESRGGYLSNADNAYVAGLGHRGYGPVLVLRGKAPLTPKTRSGDAVMAAGDLRYWSLCTNERHSTRWIDCLYDEEVGLDEEGFYTVVVSSAADKPGNVETCGIQWLRWGTSPETLLILRHMLPDPSFAAAIQNVERPGDLRDVVGDYLPVGTHTTKEAFETLDCP